MAYLSAHEEEHLREISLRGVSFRGLGAVFVLWVVVSLFLVVLILPWRLL